MSYVQRVLQPNETLIYATRLHWLVYGRAAGLLILALVASWAATQIETALQMILWAVAAGLLALAVLDGIAAALRRASTELAVTDHRVIYKRGIVGRYTIEMARSKVESVDVVQSFLGRIFNYGTILVRGTGGSLEPFRNVEDPLRLRSAIIAQ
jgi:uncharacterized membrane protein YdbT with pleckstrin-like domain